MILEFKNINKSFGEKQVLRDVCFTAQSGKAFGLLGRNGAGKTTSIRILMDVFGADGGQVLLDGKPIDYSSVSFGYLPEERGLYPRKKIGDQLVYFAELKGLSRQKAENAVDAWLARLGMSQYKNKKLETLSKGNQQKIQLITALAHDPRIVILDEPFSGLDPVNARLLKDIVRETIEKDNIVLFSSHQMNYIEEFCDDIAILNAGKVAVGGSLREIKRNYVRDKLSVKTEEPGRVFDEFGDSVKTAPDGTLILQMPSADDKKAYMSRLIECCDVDGVEVFEPSLNDIFVEYAEKEI